MSVGFGTAQGNLPHWSHLRPRVLTVRDDSLRPCCIAPATLGKSGPHVPSVRAAHTVVSNLRPLSYAPFLCGRYFAFSTATYDAVMTFLYAIDAMLKKEPDRAPSTLRGRDLYAPLSPGHIWPGTAPHLP